MRRVVIYRRRRFMIDRPTEQCFIRRQQEDLVSIDWSYICGSQAWLCSIERQDSLVSLSGCEIVREIWLFRCHGSPSWGTRGRYLFRLGKWSSRTIISLLGLKTPSSSHTPRNGSDLGRNWQSCVPPTTSPRRRIRLRTELLWKFFKVILTAIVFSFVVILKMDRRLCSSNVLHGPCRRAETAYGVTLRSSHGVVVRGFGFFWWILFGAFTIVGFWHSDRPSY